MCVCECDHAHGCEYVCVTVGCLIKDGGGAGQGSLLVNNARLQPPQELPGKWKDLERLCMK